MAHHSTLFWAYVLCICNCISVFSQMTLGVEGYGCDGINCPAPSPSHTPMSGTVSILIKRLQIHQSNM